MLLLIQHWKIFTPKCGDPSHILVGMMLKLQKQRRSNLPKRERKILNKMHDIIDFVMKNVEEIDGYEITYYQELEDDGVFG